MFPRHISRQELQKMDNKNLTPHFLMLNLGDHAIPQGRKEVKLG